MPRCSTPGNLSLAIDRTFSSGIDGPLPAQGIFGLGWVTSWQTSLSVDCSGNVTINSGGDRLFPHPAQRQLPRHRRRKRHADQSAGIYTFTDSTGDQYVFLADGQLNYEQDTNGNRITLGYNASNQLVTLTYSNPTDSSRADRTVDADLQRAGLRLAGDRRHRRHLDLFATTRPAISIPSTAPWH